jgi:hypothetical protein
VSFHRFLRTAAFGAIAPILLSASAASSQTGSEVLDRVLAVAAGEVLTLSDVRASVEFGLVRVPGAGDPFQAVLDQLIERALILSEVGHYVVAEPDSAAIESRIQDVRRSLKTQEAFDLALQMGGMTEGRLRQRLREDLRIEAYLEQRFPPAAQMTEADNARRRALIGAWIEEVRRRSEVTIFRRQTP